MSNNSISSVDGCSYTDGPQYVGCQVAERGWPMPSQSGGKRSKSKMCPVCGKRHQTGCANKSMRKGSRNRKGGFLRKAVVPVGLYALQKHTQRRRGQKKSVGKSRFNRRSRKNRSSRRR